MGLSLYPGFDSIVLKTTGEKNLYQLCGTVTVLYKDRLTLQGFCLSRISSLQKIAFSFQTDLFLFHWDHKVRPVRLASQVTHLWTLILIGYFVINCSRYSNGKVHMNQKKGLQISTLLCVSFCWKTSTLAKFRSTTPFDLVKEQADGLEGGSFDIRKNV